MEAKYAFFYMTAKAILYHLITSSISPQYFNVSIPGYRFQLSAHEIMDCLVEHGFHEGSVIDTFSYIKLRGIALKEGYPWDETKDNVLKRCSSNRKPLDFELKRINRVNPGNEEVLKRAVALIGPITVGIRLTENFIFYNEGVFYDHRCQIWYPTNHDMLLVGYGTDPVGGDYWVLKNSWGKMWGEDGFMRLARNTPYSCGITSAAFYALLNEHNEKFR